MHPLSVLRCAGVVFGSLGVLGAAHAQSPMTPGLWETHTTLKNAAMGDAMSKMQAQMASMTPEQRQMMAQAMAARGIDVGAGAGGMTTTAHVCVTKDQASRGSVPAPDRCQTQELSRSGGTVKYSYACQGEHPVSGTGEFTMTGPKAYTMHSVSDTTADGKPQHVEMDVAGTWVADDCGSVKPAGASH